jgi:hypothetical protein
MVFLHHNHRKYVVAMILLMRRIDRLPRGANRRRQKTGVNRRRVIGYKGL